MFLFIDYSIILNNLIISRKKNIKKKYFYYILKYKLTKLLKEL